MKVIKTYPRYLAQHIKLFYSVQASASENIDAVHRRLPDGTLDVVFNFGAPVLLSGNGLHFSTMADVSLLGLYSERSFLQYKGAVNLVGAVFQPGSAHLFVNDTLEHYKECTAEAASVFGNQVYDWIAQLRQPGSEQEKHRLLELFLLKHLRERKNGSHASKISGIIQEIHAAEGNIKMSELSKSHFVSDRTFRRQFNDFVGMSPKQYSTIIRVKSFSKRYELTRSSYTEIQEELGYTDQSHFSKDFQKIAGTSATNYFSQLNRMGEKIIHLI